MASVSDRFKNYSRYVSRQQKSRPPEAAMHAAIGGEFAAFGAIQVEMLRFFGLQPADRLLELGCGSGRLAQPLSLSQTGAYIGTDVVRALLDHADAICGRRDWIFRHVDGLTIPAPDGWADMVCAFSVFTHLLHEQTYLYLEEARRVLKPGGRIVFSFLEFAMQFQHNVFWQKVEKERAGSDEPLDMFMDRDAIRAWAGRLDMAIVELRDGGDAFVPLPQPVTLDDGRVMEGFGNLGQSICVLQKR